MNNLQPFEKHLADQLHQVPVPNEEQGWIEMRKLLDRELPEGGTAWSGNRKWWWMGITVAIIIAGLWMKEEFQRKQRIATNQEALNTQHQVAQSGTNATSLNEENKSNNQSTIEKKSTQSNLDNGNDNTNASASTVTNENKTNNRKKTSNDKYSVKAAQKISLAMAGSTLADRNSSAQNVQFITNSQDVSLGSDVVGSSNRRTNAELEEESLSAISVSSISSSSVFFSDPMITLASIPSSFESLKAEPGKTDKVFTKELRKHSMKADNRKMSAREMRGDIKEKDHDLTFAAGLALPQSFAISGQQAPSYGVNATASRASDYLPVPYFQYHMNPRLFLQTELQFQSPQYTDRLLVYQGQQQVPQSSSMVEKNIFIEKLYYFHIPFNVYFSPAKNFYVGSGIQFSSLLSGVATYQSNVYSGSTLQNSYSRVESFKDDSLASKLSSSEWRYQLDANYYLKRFTFGARYNQAFSQFVNIQPSPTLPSTVGRNQSFFIYLRYNIWEERKK